MSVYKQARGVTFRYRFYFGGVPYRGNTLQKTKELAEQFETKLKEDLRKRAGGLVEFDPQNTPTWTAAAGLTLKYQSKFISRPGILERTLRMVLAFWGAPPATPIGPAAVARAEAVPRPYHNLRLGDPIADPSWLAKFEEWMEARGVSGSTRNSYLSACSDIYTCALQPLYRATTHIATNPFEGIRRSKPRGRIVTLTPEQIVALITNAGRHIAHALVIAALAPKLRVTTILALEWARDFDPDLTRITIADHKTAAKAGAQTVPVSDQLRAHLLAIRAEQKPPSPYVITYYGGYGHTRAKPVHAIQSVKTGLRRAVEAIGLKWGMQDGVTFHVMRHSVATILADPALVGGLTERQRADLMGHRELRTTQQYTHLNPWLQAGPHEALSAALPGLRAAATRPTRQAKVSRVKSMHTGPEQSQKPQQNRVVSFAAGERQNRKTR